MTNADGTSALKLATTNGDRDWNVDDEHGNGWFDHGTTPDIDGDPENRAGYNETPAASSSGAGDDELAALMSDNPAEREPVEPLESATPRRGWALLDLDEIGQGERVPPTIGGLFYRSGRHLLYGSNSAMKTVLMARCISECIQRGRYVLWADTDGHDAFNLRETLLDLGLTPEQIRTPEHGGFLLMYQPTGTFAIDREEVSAAAKKHDIELAVIDSAIGALAREGSDSNSDTDVDNWWIEVGDHLRGNNGCIVAIDHTGNDPVNQGRPRGSSRKLDAVYCAIQAKKLKGFGRGRTGVQQLTVGKDHGAYHPPIGSAIGKYTYISDPDTHEITCSFEKATGDSEERSTFRPTGTMERITHTLYSAPGQSYTQAELKELVKARNGATPTAIRVLADEGYVAIVKENRTLRVTLIKSYREASDPLIGARSDAPEDAG